MPKLPVNELVGSLALLISDAYRTKRKVLICGNGGLAAEAEHFAAELMGKFGREFFVPCIALTSNTSLLTALANDYGYEEVFAHQVSVLGVPGDVLIAMTTSASRNIVKALVRGKEQGLKTVCLCGPGSPDMEADMTIRTGGEDEVAAIQQDILAFLHCAAYDAKGQLA